MNPHGYYIKRRSFPTWRAAVWLIGGMLIASYIWLAALHRADPFRAPRPVALACWTSAEPARPRNANNDDPISPAMLCHGEIAR
jgi:hypothetical protein